MPARKPRQIPPVGAAYTKTYKNKSYTLKVVKSDSGVGYKLGSTVYPSPSAAAKSLTKTEVNGWKFWKID